MLLFPLNTQIYEKTVMQLMPQKSHHVDLKDGDCFDYTFFVIFW